MGFKPIKIAVMMRAIDQESGFRAFMENLIKKMLEIDSTNRFVLIYKSSKWFGRYRSYENAEEVLITSENKFFWDQVAVPLAAWKHKADIIYNPKFSVPFVSPCPVAMGLQEPAWWIWPEHYERFDVLYQRIMLPAYCRKASYFFPWSQFVLDENRRYLGLKFQNSTITPPAPKEDFRPVADSLVIEAFKKKYDLPKKIILSVTRVDHPGLEGSKSFHGGKNVDTTIKAYLMIKDLIPHRLVIAGRRVKDYLLDRGWTEKQLDGIHFMGFVPHNELPLLFNAADVFVMPSFYEGFGLTLVEAMACGCPSVVSSTGACPEVSGGAALTADPNSPKEFGDRIVSILSDSWLRNQLKAKSLERAASYSWERTARRTIDGLVKVVTNYSFAAAEDPAVAQRR